MDKYINESMKEACAEIEARQSWEDEQFMQEMDTQLSTDELEEVAWNAYQQSDAFAELERRIKFQEEQSAAWRINLLSEEL